MSETPDIQFSDEYRVFKFGGSSQSTPERLHQVVETVAGAAEECRLAVVVSAMGASTDWLLEAVEAAARGDLETAEELVDRVADLATTTGVLTLNALEEQHGALASRPNLTAMVRELVAPLRQLLLGVSLLKERTAQTTDLVLSFGEVTSARVLAELLRARGIDAVFSDARDWVVTDDSFGEAVVHWEATRDRIEALKRDWGPHVVPVNTGFLGKTTDGRTTTLGRNGSDYTATLLGRALDAEEVVICTDVLGVMTADPAIVDDAYPVAGLSYLEALELANYGARMFHPRTMLPLMESGIPMRIRQTMSPGAQGTRITASKIETSKQPTCVTSLENLALIEVRWRQLEQQAQMGQRVLSALEDAGITVWMATQAAHGQSVAVVIPEHQLEDADVAIRAELALEIDRHEVEPLESEHPVTLLSLVAEGMRESETVAGRFFQALATVGTNVLAIAQGKTSRSISCVISADDTDVAVRTAHTAFNFAHQEVSIMLLGRGLVGGHLLQQIDQQAEHLLEHHDVDLRMVGVANSAEIIFEEDGLSPTEAEGRSGSSTANERDEMLETLERLRRMPVPILVDCTAADGLEWLYEAAFERGIHVVAANKKPLTTPQQTRDRLMAVGRKNHRSFHYETTVGASLPVIESLKNLVRTGDRVALIEGALSGTLGYLTNEVMKGVPLSEAVATAKELGYTEPRPQDDLSGLDVARKALILARELGLNVDIEHVPIEPLVPAPILDVDDDQFFDALAEFDEELGEKVDQHSAQGETLRYMAVIEPGSDDEDARVEVGPIWVPADHPATHLRGAESFVAFTTERYRDYPLIVRGAGAGGAVTAAGVLSDILRVAQTLKGN